MYRNLLIVTQHDDKITIQNDLSDDYVLTVIAQLLNSQVKKGKDLNKMLKTVKSLSEFYAI